MQFFIPEKMSVHGLATALGANHIRSTVFWSTIFLVSSIVYLYQFHLLVKQYRQKNTLIEPRMQSGYLPFPAVTLCNLNSVRSSEMARVPELAALNHAADQLSKKEAANTKIQKRNIQEINVNQPSTSPCGVEECEKLDRSKREETIYDIPYNETIDEYDNTSVIIEVEYSCDNSDVSARSTIIECANDEFYFDEGKLLFCSVNEIPYNDTIDENDNTSLILELEYNCDNGEASAYDVILKCAKNDKCFDEENLLFCTEHCPSPRPQPGHLIDPPVSLVTPGDTLRHSCEPGHVLIGNTNQTCYKDSNQFDYETPDCYKVEEGIEPCSPEYDTICEEGGQCFMKNGIEYCICEHGWKGVRCENAVDHCESMPCHYLATCLSGPEGVVCNCAPGFNGSTCFNDIDECEHNQCSADSVCMHYINGWRCVPQSQIDEARNTLLKMLNHSGQATKTTNPESLYTQLQDATSYLVHSLTLDMRRQLGHSLNQTVLDCTFALENNCKWFEIQHNRFGTCHTFNAFKHNQSITIIPGNKYGLQLLLDAAPEEYSKFVSTIGFKISFTAPDTHPFLEFDGLNVVPDHTNIFVLTYKRILLMTAPYGVCADSSEIPYLFPGNYSVFGCQLSTKQKQIGEECNCASPMYAMPNSSSLVCPLTKKMCIDRIEGEHTNFKDYCKPACRREFYKVFSTKTSKLEKPMIIRRNNKKGLTRVFVYFNTLLAVNLAERVSYDCGTGCGTIGDICDRVGSAVANDAFQNQRIAEKPDFIRCAGKTQQLLQLFCTLYITIKIDGLGSSPGHFNVFFVLCLEMWSACQLFSQVFIFETSFKYFLIAQSMCITLRSVQ